MVHVDVIIVLKQRTEKPNQAQTGRQTCSVSNLSVFIMLLPKLNNTM